MPPAEQLPADGHEIALTLAVPVVTLRTAMPGTSTAGCQWPAVRVITHTCVVPVESTNCPPAPHWPGAAHETVVTVARYRVGTGTCLAVSHRPLRSAAVNHCWRLPRFRYVPTATQTPVRAHEIDLTRASPCLLSASVPGTSIALPQRPLRSMTAKACG